MDHAITSNPLVQLAIIWVGVVIAFYCAKRTRLTPVLYYLAVGALFVNLGILPNEPDAFVRGLAEIGIVLIMFALGFKENIQNFIQSVKKSWGIAFFGALFPFVVAFSVAQYFWQSTHISTMCGLAMTATAVSLTMVALKSDGLQRTQAATRIMTSAVLDDIASLALVAILVPIASGETVPNIQEIGTIVGKAVVFFVLIAVVSTYVLPHPKSGWLFQLKFLNWFGMNRMLSFDESRQATLIALLFAVGVALLGYKLGLHPAVGAYMAGLILREDYFLVSDNPDAVGTFKDTSRIVESVAFSWIGPIFFVQLGTHLVVDLHVLVSVIPQTIALTIGLLVFQISSAGVASYYTGGLDKKNSLLVGLGMLGRAELAFVVMDIAYVQHRILSTEAFYTLMFTAFWLNVAVPVSIKLWKRRFGDAAQIED